MKSLIVIVTLLSSLAFAEESKVSTSSKKTETPVESIVKGGKKERKKKVEMCHDCGKPESQCECEGEEHKKDEEKVN